MFTAFGGLANIAWSSICDTKPDMAAATYKEHSLLTPAAAIAETSAAVKEHFASEFGEQHSNAVIEKALRTWLDGKIDLVLEEMPELLTSPGTTESKEFASVKSRNTSNH